MGKYCCFAGYAEKAYLRGIAMKRLLVLTIVAAVVFSMAATAFAADPMGAVKVDLFDTENPEIIVGWAIFNTNTEGILIVRVHLNDGEPD